MVSQLIFKSFIHLEFVFVYGVSWWSSFLFLQVAVQISQQGGTGGSGGGKMETTVLQQ